MLNFGTEIAADSSVDCLVCQQSFNTPHSSHLPGSAPKQTKSLGSETAAMPTRSESDTMPAPKVNPKTSAREKRAAQNRLAVIARNPGAKIIFAVLGIGFLVVMTAGAGMSMWKRSGGPVVESRPNSPNEQLLAVNKNVVPDKPAKEEPRPPVDNVPPLAETTKPEPLEIRTETPAVKLQRRADRPTEPAEKRPEVPAAKDAEVPIPVVPPVNPGIAPPAIGGLDPNRPLPWGVDQAKINAAIDRGVVSLKANQNANGSWGSAYPIGHAAIGGLTLLESGVPPNDPVIQRAALLVRNNTANLDETYELSLAILFLDRLGARQDRFTIQTLALRLVAGQTASGGWSYHCRVLNPTEMNQLFTFLHATKKPSVFDNNLRMARAQQPGDANLLMAKEPADKTDPVKEFRDRVLLMANENPMPPSAPANPPGKIKGPAAKANPAANWLKQNLQTLPILQQQAAKKGQYKLTGDRSDNSNTQFALLALWVAGRHDVPAGPAFLASHQRFFASQRPDGGWSYHPISAKGSTPSMTCVGLLGMAMGHGAQPEVVGVNPKNAKEIVIKPAIQDPRVQTGVKALARAIGTPSPKAKLFPMHNLYELWSIERVAMLYDLKAIDGKDWYGWGAQNLLHNQRADGAWGVSSYHGQNPHLNTCLALLFLKRSNLAPDLTRSLRLESASREPLRVDRDDAPQP
jgi:hypothetical protein